MLVRYSELVVNKVKRVNIKVNVIFNWGVMVGMYL